MARGTEAFATKFTDAQKQAAVHAVLVDGMTARQAANKAAAGQLPGVGKFPITRNYINVLVRRAKHSRDPDVLTDRGEARVAIEEARARVLAWILREADRYEQQCKTGQVDLAQAGRLLRALTEWEKSQTRPEKPEPGNPDQPEDQSAETLVQGLLEQAAKPNGSARAKAAIPVSPADETETESSDLPA